MNTKQAYVEAYRVYRQFDGSCTNLQLYRTSILCKYGTIGAKAIESRDNRSYPAAMPTKKQFNPDIYRAAHRLGQMYERSILLARFTHNPGDYDKAIESEKILDGLVRSNPEHWLYTDFVNGRNSIRAARNLELINL